MATTEVPPQRVPVPRDPEDDYSREAASRRAQFVHDQTGVELEHVGAYSFDPTTVAGNVEQFVRKLTEIVAATVLCGELSLGSAIVAEEWVKAHDLLGRNRA